MARIPLQIASRSLDTGSVVSYPSGSPVGEAISRVGTTLSGIAQVIKQRQDQRDEFERVALDNEFDARLDSIPVQLLSDPKLAPDGAGLAAAAVGAVDPRTGQPTKGGAFDNLLKEFLPRIPESQRSTFLARVEEKRIRLGNRMVAAQFDQEQKFYAVKTDEITTKLVNDILTTDPNDRDTFEEVKARGLEAIDASGLLPLQKQIARQKWSGEAGKALAQSILANDPAAASKIKGMLGFAPKVQRVPTSGDAGKRSQQAMAFFVGRGYSQHAAAGIVGNLLAESSLNTGARNKGDGSDGSDSIGIAQWNSGRAVALKRFAADHGADWRDFGIQLAFVDHELKTSHKGIGDRLRASGDVVSAAEAGIMFEGPAGSQHGPKNAHNYRGRVNFAKQLAGVEISEEAPDPAFADMPPEDRLALFRQAEVAEGKQTASYTAGLSDYLSFLRDGNDPDTLGTYGPGQLAANLPPEIAASAQEQINEARAFGQDKAALEFATPAEVQTILSERAALTQSPTGYANNVRDVAALQATLKARNEVIAADPAAYVARQPAIGQAFDDMQSAPQDAVAARSYAVATLGEQNRLGVPAAAQRILPSRAVAAIGEQFANQKQGSQNAATLMRGLEAQWGDNWPRVFGELAAAKALPGTALVVGAMNRPDQARAAEALAVAATIGTTELEKAITPAAKKTVSETVDTSLDAFGKTLANNGSSGVATFNTFREGVYQLALSYARSEEPSAAAARAVKDVIERKYAIRDTYRVPVEFNADEISDKAESIISRLTGEGLVLPVSGLNEAQTRAAYLSQLQANGYWVTNGDETGLTLFDETGTAVVKGDGSPLSFTWQQILGQDDRVSQSSQTAPPETAPMLAPPQKPFNEQARDIELQQMEERARRAGQFGPAPSPPVALPPAPAQPTLKDKLDQRRSELFENAPEPVTTFGSAM